MAISPPFSGHATPQHTKSFLHDSQQQSTKTNSKSYRISPTKHTLSNIGIGTYLGDQTTQTDHLVADAIIESVNGGINVIDSASNYRKGGGERAVGLALDRLLSSEDDNIDDGKKKKRRRLFQREELFIATKAGFTTPEISKRAKKLYSAPSSDFVSQGRHCISSPCLRASIDISLQRMKVHTIDLLYLHNVAEKRVDTDTDEQILESIRKAFEHLEQERQGGRIRYYGLATFSKSFRVSSNERGGMELDDIVRLAKRAAGCSDEQEEEECDHGMKYVQLPVSPHSMPEMYKSQFQQGGTESLAQTAKRLGVGLMSSKSLGAPKDEKKVACLDFSSVDKTMMNDDNDNKARVLHVTRSSPGLLTALVGHKAPEHVRSNLEVLKISPLEEEDFYRVVAKC